jgi:hypothetical protein
MNETSKKVSQKDNTIREDNINAIWLFQEKKKGEFFLIRLINKRIESQGEYQREEYKYGGTDEVYSIDKVEEKDQGELVKSLKANINQVIIDKTDNNVLDLRILKKKPPYLSCNEFLLG